MPRMWNGYLVSAQNGIASLTARCANTNVAIPRRSSIDRTRANAPLPWRRSNRCLLMTFYCVQAGRIPT
jgi:hypothetical protein